VTPDKFYFVMVGAFKLWLAAVCACVVYEIGKRLWRWRADALGLHESHPVQPGPPPLSEAAIRALCVVCGPEGKRHSAGAIADRRCIVCHECVERMALQGMRSPGREA
jgi:hypothetical protein